MERSDTHHFEIEAGLRRHGNDEEQGQSNIVQTERNVSTNQDRRSQPVDRQQFQAAGRQRVDKGAVSVTHSGTVRSVMPVKTGIHLRIRWTRMNLDALRPPPE